MVMATSAIHGQRECAASQRVDTIIHGVLNISPGASQGQETHCRQHLLVISGNLVSGDLFGQKLIIGFVPVERIDDVVTIGERIDKPVGHSSIIVIATAGIRIAC